MMSKDWRLVINLANSVCGVALLALPHCFSQCGVVLGSLLLLASAYLTIQSCKLLVKVAFHTDCYTYEGMALQMFGVYGKVAMEISSIGLMLGTCSAFFVIVTDLAPVLVTTFLEVDTDPFQLRIVVSLLLGVCVVFPLCLLKRLETLSYLSAVSLLFYASLAFQLLFLSVDNMSNEETLQQVLLWRTSGVFNIVPIFALAFSCHLQLCHMIGEVPDPTASRMNSVVQYALSTVGLVYGSMALFGHIAFCTTEVKGDILTNFGDNVAAQTTRTGFTVAVLISFPFMVTPCRACVYSVLFRRGPQSDSSTIPQDKFIAITACIVCITWFIAVTTPNVEIVLSLTGSICGSIVCFIFPALAYMAIPAKNFRKFEWKPKVVLGMGLILMIGGSLVAMSDRFNDEGAVAAIHELAGAPPEPVFQQLVDGRLPLDKEKEEGRVEKDSEGQGDVNPIQKETLNNDEGVPALVLDSQNEHMKPNKEMLKEGTEQQLLEEHGLNENLSLDEVVLKEEKKDRHLRADSQNEEDGLNEDVNLNKKLLKEEEKERHLGADSENEQGGWNAEHGLGHRAMFEVFPSDDAEKGAQESVDVARKGKTSHSSHIHDEIANQPISAVAGGDMKTAKLLENEMPDQDKQGGVVSNEQEEVLGQQKQVLVEQRQVSNKQEKVSNRQEMVSSQMKVISDQQKQVMDQQKEISEQQEQILSKHDNKVSHLGKELMDLKDQVSELKVQVDGLASDKKPAKSNESSATSEFLVDSNKEKSSVAKSGRKSKLKSAESLPASVLTEKDSKKSLHNSEKKPKRKN